MTDSHISSNTQLHCTIHETPVLDEDSPDRGTWYRDRDNFGVQAPYLFIITPKSLRVRIHRPLEI